MESHLASLIARLESLVDRFEKAAVALNIPPASSNNNTTTANATANTTSTTTTTTISNAGQNGNSSSQGNSQLEELLRGFDKEVVSKVGPMEEAAKAIGGDIIPNIVSIG